MYKINKKLHRIDWIYSEYANVTTTSLSQFITSINDTYYSNSANLYSSRFVSDIHREYENMFNSINIRNKINMPYIVDIGGGTGFEYDLFKRFSLKFHHFKYIEPSKDMMGIFKKSLTKDKIDKLSFHNGHFSDVVDVIKEEPNKLLIINSALHHIIWLEPMLDDIKASMKAGDLFVLGHEPNNNYSQILMFIQKLIRAVFSTALLKRLPFLSRSRKNDVNRWNSINEELIKKGNINKKMSPLLIRRIIDYGVGYKNDWMKLNIPKEYNEGFWNAEDLSSYLGSDFNLLYYRTYRHIGDSRGNWVIEAINRLMGKLLKYQGTNFIAVWEKRSN
ncbi:class I SAM-dependent methyltransferase [Woeseiaceae bacterium]|nr:class I SAM-dependent methyltransferase [Woeseiaceae bacterium]